MFNNEHAIVYAALILHDDGKEITADRLQTLVKSAGLADSVQSVWYSLYAKALAGQDIKSLLFNVGSSAGGAAASAGTGAAGAGAAAEEAVEEKKEEAKEESDDDMGFGLFD